jgi:hypothetical protein
MSRYTDDYEYDHCHPRHEDDWNWYDNCRHDWRPRWEPDHCEPRYDDYWHHHHPHHYVH